MELCLAWWSEEKIRLRGRMGGGSDPPEQSLLYYHAVIVLGINNKCAKSSPMFHPSVLLKPVTRPGVT